MSAVEPIGSSRQDMSPEIAMSNVTVLPCRFEPTEQGTMRRLLAEHGDDLMYVADAARWYSWDGRRWARDQTGEVQRRTKATVDGLIDAVGDEPDLDRRKALVNHWGKAQTAHVQRGIIELARTEADVAVTIADLDRDPWALNVRNGTLDLRTGELGPARREDRITKLAPVDYEPDAACPTWERFVRWACCEDDELVEYLQRLVGYTLTGDVSEQLLVFCLGAGANGKTTFLTVLQAMLGLDDDGHACQAPPRLLVSSRHEQHPTQVADLVGRRLVVCTEVDADDRFDEVLVKQLTGGDPLKARFMRQDFFTFQPTGTFWLAANHKPNVRGTDHAIWRRIKLVPFNATVTDDDRDPHLVDKLLKELPGILAWAVRGCRAWQSDGLGAARAVLDATDRYRAEQDVFSQFLDDCCVLGDMYVVGATDLHDAFRTWCSSNGTEAVTPKALAPTLRDRGFESSRHPRSRQMQWRGFRLIAHASDRNAGPDPDRRNDPKRSAV